MRSVENPGELQCLGMDRRKRENINWLFICPHQGSLDDFIAVKLVSGFLGSASRMKTPVLWCIVRTAIPDPFPHLTGSRFLIEFLIG